MRIQFEIKESLINILDQLMHSDFWATEIKEDESGKKIIKIKDLAYNLEAVAEVMGNEIFIKTALSKYTYRIYEVKGECWCEYVGPIVVFGTEAPSNNYSEGKSVGM